MTSLLIASIALQGAAQAKPAEQTSTLIGLNVILTDKPEASDSLRASLATVASRAKDWHLETNSPDAKKFRCEVFGGVRYWIDEPLLEGGLYTAAERVWDLLQTKGMALRGRLSDFDKDDQDALLLLLSNGAWYTQTEQLRAKLKEPGAEICVSFTAELRGKDGGTLHAINPKYIRIPERSGDATQPLPTVQSRQIVYQTVPRTNDLTMEEVTRQGFAILARLRKANLKRFEQKLADSAMREYKTRWANPKSWDGKSPVTFGQLDPDAQAAIRSNFEDRTFIATEEIAPLWGSITLGIGRLEGGVFHIQGASVSTSLG
ncbi:hypothetical protein BH11ARM2_BH11ARM2_09910 [soil metagenome]